MSLLDSCVTVSATSKQEQEFNENKLREIAFAEKVFGACWCTADVQAIVVSWGWN